jgi:hypothetical protein
MAKTRGIALATLGLVAAATAGTTLFAADAPAAPQPNDPRAEQILRQARDAIGKARRLEIEHIWSYVNGHIETEERGRETLYFEKSGGYLFEIQPVDVAGQASRALTQSGRAFRLRSSTRNTTKQICVNGSVTFLDDVSHTCQTERLVGDDDFTKFYKPEDFIGRYIPPGLNWATGWNDVRSRYRIEHCASTPTTVCIALILRPDSPDYDRSEPERHEIVFDRRTLLPRTWRKIRGDLDSLKTYSRFELNPAPRDLKVPPAGYREAPPTPLQYNLNVSTISSLDSDGPEAALAQAEQVRHVMLLKATFCALRLVHLF